VYEIALWSNGSFTQPKYQTKQKEEQMKKIDNYKFYVPDAPDGDEG
jgi:hypothetical protein